MLKTILHKLFGIEINEIDIVDSKHLYYTLSQNTIDKSVRPDLKSMRSFFETVVDVFAWISVS